MRMMPDTPGRDRTEPTGPTLGEADAAYRAPPGRVEDQRRPLAEAPGAPAETRAETRAESDVIEIIENEQLSHTSPDGRPPAPRSRRLGTEFLAVATLLVLVGVTAILWYQGGPVAMLAGLFVLIVYMGAAFPVWGAGLLRKHEKVEADHRVRRAMGAGPGPGRHDH